MSEQNQNKASGNGRCGDDQLRGPNIEQWQLTAFILGELDDEATATLAAAVAEDATLAAEIAALKQTIGQVESLFASEKAGGIPDRDQSSRFDAIWDAAEGRGASSQGGVAPASSSELRSPPWSAGRAWITLAVTAACLLIVLGLSYPTLSSWIAETQLASQTGESPEASDAPAGPGGKRQRDAEASASGDSRSSSISGEPLSFTLDSTIAEHSRADVSAKLQAVEVQEAQMQGQAVPGDAPFSSSSILQSGGQALTDASQSQPPAPASGPGGYGGGGYGGASNGAPGESGDGAMYGGAELGRGGMRGAGMDGAEMDGAEMGGAEMGGAGYGGYREASKQGQGAAGSSGMDGGSANAAGDAMEMGDRDYADFDVSELGEARSPGAERFVESAPFEFEDEFSGRPPANASDTSGVTESEARIGGTGYAVDPAAQSRSKQLGQRGLALPDSPAPVLHESVLGGMNGRAGSQSLKKRISENNQPLSRRSDGGRRYEALQPSERAATVGGDRFDPIYENRFLAVGENPLSTFSIDVDTASYAKSRQLLLEAGRLPPASAVRIEEFVNYFEYEYTGPKNKVDPFAADLAVSECPWQPEHKLVRIALQAEKLDLANRPRANIVFLLDVSGSMDAPNKLPLVKESMRMLIKQLGEKDKVAMVVYAGAAGCVLEGTRGDKQGKILGALDRLNAGGSTNGGQGIQLAYDLARDNFVEAGINRVILCTDGDFNVGVTNTSSLVDLVQENAKSKIFLTVLGYGMGNTNDAMMEQISNRGNGVYGFVDNRREAYRQMVKQVAANLVTVAKDVKIQVEFNPSQVGAYRLLGYENRMMADRDFDDDTKDAGEIGAGHRVTALYEVVPVDVAAGEGTVGGPVLRYQQKRTQPRSEARQEKGGEFENELLVVNLRYKQPEGDVSKLLVFPLQDQNAEFADCDRDFRWAASMVEFGMLLRGSRYSGNAAWSSLIAKAESAAGISPTADRQECLEMIRTAARLSGR